MSRSLHVLTTSTRTSTNIVSYSITPGSMSQLSGSYNDYNIQTTIVAGL